MAEWGECETNQDEKMQGTCTEGFVCTNDVTSSDSVRVIDTVCMSDVTTSNIVQDKGSSHVPLESNQHKQNNSVPRVEYFLYFIVGGEHAKDRE